MRGFGLPGRAGYVFSNEEKCFVPPSVLRRDGAGRLYRVLELEPPSSLPREALAFSDEDASALLKFMLDSADSPPPGLFASCDHYLDRKRKRVVLKMVLAGDQDPGPDASLAPAIKALFETGFLPSCKHRLTAASYAAVQTVELARLCRVITRSPVEDVRAALEQRGVPSADILSVTAKKLKGTQTDSGSVLINLSPCFPVDRVPWKIALQEPGECLVPRKVMLEGPGCNVCRAAKHKQKQCPAFKEELCGRCQFPLKTLAAQGKDPRNHDCEGGPSGYGVQFLDLSGDQWHTVWKQWRATLPALAVSEDPFAEIRAASLRAAQDAALAAKSKTAGGASSRKRRRERRAGGASGEFDTPDPKQQQLESTPAALELP